MAKNPVLINRRETEGAYNTRFPGQYIFGFGGYYRGVAANDNSLSKRSRFTRLALILSVVAMAVTTFIVAF